MTIICFKLEIYKNCTFPIEVKNKLEQFELDIQLNTNIPNFILNCISLEYNHNLLQLINGIYNDTASMMNQSEDILGFKPSL